MPPPTLPDAILAALDTYRDATLDAAHAVGADFDTTEARGRARLAVVDIILRALAEAEERGRAAGKADGWREACHDCARIVDGSALPRSHGQLDTIVRALRTNAGGSK
jgi:hypothetical protein